MHLVGNTALVAAALGEVEVAVMVVVAVEENIVDCRGSRMGTPHILWKDQEVLAWFLLVDHASPEEYQWRHK